jgi:hypothetical protein
MEGPKAGIGPGWTGFSVQGSQFGGSSRFSGGPVSDLGGPVRHPGMTTNGQRSGGNDGNV